MYVRKKPNRSGSISVVVIEKKDGKVHYLKTLGVSSDAAEIEDLYLQGKSGLSNKKDSAICFWNTPARCSAARLALCFYLEGNGYKYIVWTRI